MFIKDMFTRDMFTRDMFTRDIKARDILIAGLLLNLSVFSGCEVEKYENEDEAETLITSAAIDITAYYPESVFGNVYRSWDEIGDYARLDPVVFTNNEGETHYYELVVIPEADVEWLCAAYLAQQSGGYLVCPESEEENEFVFSLVDQYSYWYTWDESHNNVTSGPPIGGFQEWDESAESDPSAGWMWLSGNTMDFTSWCQNPDDGVLDSDPRDNTQPNDSNVGNQDVMCYGEITSRVAAWGDFPARFGDLQGGEGGTFYAFVIEYETNPDEQAI